MNTAEINALIDEKVTNITEDGGITEATLGALLKSVVATLKPYKQLLALVSISGGTVTPTILVNDFGDGAVTLSNPSTGVLRASITGSQITAQTKVITSLVMQGSTPYRVIPALNLGYVDMNIQQWDGTQTTTPNITNQIVEIRVYN